MIESDPWVTPLRLALHETNETFVTSASLLAVLGEDPSNAQAKRRLRRCMDEVGWMPHRVENQLGYRPGRNVERKREQMPQNERFTKDEFGVLTWPAEGACEGDCSPAVGRSIELSENCHKYPPYAWQAATDVLAQLETSQAIAVTLFGAHWREHIFQVFDRLRVAQQDASVEERMRPPSVPEAP
jgi:hypothetical protein